MGSAGQVPNQDTAKTHTHRHFFIYTMMGHTSMRCISRAFSSDDQGLLSCQSEIHNHRLSHKDTGIWKMPQKAKLNSLQGLSLSLLPTCPVKKVQGKQKQNQLAQKFSGCPNFSLHALRLKTSHQNKITTQ